MYDTAAIFNRFLLRAVLAGTILVVAAVLSFFPSLLYPITWVQSKL